MAFNQFTAFAILKELKSKGVKTDFGIQISQVSLKIVGSQLPGTCGFDQISWNLEGVRTHA